MDWGHLPLAEFTWADGLHMVKVAETAVRTYVQGTYRDGNVRLDVHATGNGRLVGYTLKGKRARKGRPLRLIRPMFLSLFYTREDRLGRLPMTIMYHDYNMRLLSFGEDKARDYLMVLRSKQER